MELELKLNNPDYQLAMIAGALRQINKIIDLRTFYQNLQEHLTPEDAEEAFKDLLAGTELIPDFDVDETTPDQLLELL